MGDLFQVVPELTASFVLGGTSAAPNHLRQHRKEA
jgi:hypothetical protein